MASTTTLGTTQVTSTPQTLTATTIKRTKNDLDKDDFLRLLVSEMQYQDPMNPMDSKDFMAEMAQFSALEQMRNVGLQTSKLLTMALLGRQVEAEGHDGQSITGTVKALSFGTEAIALIVQQAAAADPVQVELDKVRKVD